MSCCQSYRQGDITRRNFLHIGVLPFLGINLVSALSALAETGRSIKSCIFFYLGGGISHIDTYDPKPEASSEIRGVYKPIQTDIPGFFLSELFPEQGKIADKICLIRSLQHDSDDHGFAERRVITGSSRTGEPFLGTVFANLNRRHQNKKGSAIRYIFLGSYDFNYYHTTNGSEFVGVEDEPLFVPEDPNRTDFKVNELQIANGITFDEFSDRKTLLDKLDNWKHDFAKRAENYNVHQQKVFDILTGKGIAKAFDIDQETRGTCDEYGRTTIGQRALLARRLVEVGVHFVAIDARGYSDIGWDYHRNIFAHMPKAAEPFDKAIAGLITDLDDRGILDETLVVAYGEFGRTPKINNEAGRDHWPKVGSVLMAGLDLPRGHVYGASNKNGERVIENTVKPEDLIATIYKLLGFDPENAENRLYTKGGRNRPPIEGRIIDFSE